MNIWTLKSLSFLYALVVVLLGTCSFDALADEDVGLIQEAIVFSTDDVATNPDSIGQWRRDAVVCVDVGNCCTGTLISPRLVLTAYHCVNDFVPRRVKFGVVAEDWKEIEVLGCLPHPRARSDRAVAACGDGGERNRHYDMALLVLKERIDRGVHAEPLTRNYPAIPAGLLTYEDCCGPGGPGAGDLDFWEGRQVRISGWGSTSDDSDVFTPPRLRQARFVEITDVEPDTGATRYQERFTEIYTWYKERPGDSGGPAYRGDPDTEPISLIGTVQGPWTSAISDGRLVGTESRYVGTINYYTSVWLTNLTTGSWGPVWLGSNDVPPRTDPSRRARDAAVDVDGDGLVSHDNCPPFYNPEQKDEEGDGIDDLLEICTLLELAAMMAVVF